MRVLVTGHNGYIGSVMVPLLQAAGHQVIGLDTYLFSHCTIGPDGGAPFVARHGDIRDVTVEDMAGIDAVIHLAGISNDPLGDLNADCTYDINHLASVHLARTAKAAGVSRFIFSSSCSLYGSSGDDYIDESAEFNPVTPYGWSKINTEQDVGPMADDDFSPTFMRSSTAYGFSPRLRADLVVNNLVGFAYLDGEALIKSDGSPWRPLVHIEDISRAFLAVLEAPRELIHNEAFNVGVTSENYQVRDVGDIVADVVDDAKVVYASDASPDIRNYRVNCDKLPTTLPAFQPEWTVRKGVEQLYEAYQRYGLTNEDFHGSLLRIRHVKGLQEAGKLDGSLRWTETAQEELRV
ncbi:MAG: SDR family oxidoreductase [Acidimicrobiia bacterium]|nr:SDR family oxidoreductase [Acidimicrobiia bacterium]